MKRLLLTVKEDSEETERTYVLEGDRRQSNDRMIQQGLEKLLKEPVAFVDEEKRLYRTEESDRDVRVVEARLIDEESARNLKQKHFTLVINENVTEGSCRVRYS